MKTRCLNCMEEYEGHADACPHCGASTKLDEQESLTLKPGTLLQERYIVGNSLGSGGFGVTYIGWDTTLQKKIAIKEFLPSGLATRAPGQTCISVLGGQREEEFKRGLQSFYEEAVHLARFSEPGIVDIFDCIHENNTAYIIMEFLEGSTLAQLLQADGPMTLPQALNILAPLLKSLEVIHNEGMLHRDIAPDNIIVTKNGTVKLIDFGAARYASSNYSRSMTVLFKEGYAPEEQYRKLGNQGPWSDIYALGATAYKMLTGVTPPQSIERVVKDTLQPPSRMGAELPGYADNAIMNALSVFADNRTSSAVAFLHELTSGTAKPVAVKSGVSKKLVVALTAFVAVVTAWAVISTMLFLQKRDPKANPAAGRTQEHTQGQADKTVSNNGHITNAPKKAVAVGERLEFGGYNWIVLDVRGDEVLVLSEEIIENRPYHQTYEQVSWETCDLRSYLNGEFYNSFSEQDRTRIIQTTVKNTQTFDDRTPVEYDTVDYIFLLSPEEADKYFSNRTNRQVLDKDSSTLFGCWWLRTPVTDDEAFIVRPDGGFSDTYVDKTTYSNDRGMGVRPAMWIFIPAQQEPSGTDATHLNETERVTAFLEQHVSTVDEALALYAVDPAIHKEALWAYIDSTYGQSISKALSEALAGLSAKEKKQYEEQIEQQKEKLFASTMQYKYCVSSSNDTIVASLKKLSNEEMSQFKEIYTSQSSEDVKKTGNAAEIKMNTKILDARYGLENATAVYRAEVVAQSRETVYVAELDDQLKLVWDYAGFSAYSDIGQ